MADKALAWLGGLTPAGEAVHTWGAMPIRIRSYVTGTWPPAELVTSVRCIVMRGTGLRDVPVMRNRDGRHIWPGGRREGNETPEQTVRRELLEEAGCTVQTLVYLGFLHLRHLAPKPDQHPYLYPDFFQIVYDACAERYDPAVRLADDYELESGFEPEAAVRVELHELGVPAFLTAALHALSGAI